MSALNVRRAAATDIPRLAELWYEKMVLLQQADSRFAVPVQGSARWSKSVEGWLNDSRCCVLVAENEMQIAGYIVGWTQFAPMMLFEDSGVISEIALDMHTYQKGAGRMLFEALQDWFHQHHIERCIAVAPRLYAVEQAFWRALGASPLMDVLWIK